MTGELPLCECGCGQRVSKIGNRFINGHNRKGKIFKPKPEPQLCACGCGGYANVGYRFILGHHLKGKRRSLETISKISKTKMGHAVSNETRLKMSITHTGVLLSEKTCIAMSKAKKGRKLSDSHKSALSVVWKDHPEIWNNRNEMMRGGSDIVNHHYIYDHADLSLNTVKITRSDHMSLHLLLRRLDYIIPHINMKGDE